MAPILLSGHDCDDVAQPRRRAMRRAPSSRTTSKRHGGSRPSSRGSPAPRRSRRACFAARDARRRRRRNRARERRRTSTNTSESPSRAMTSISPLARAEVARDDREAVACEMVGRRSPPRARRVAARRFSAGHRAGRSWPSRKTAKRPSRENWRVRRATAGRWRLRAKAVRARRRLNAAATRNASRPSA